MVSDGDIGEADSLAHQGALAGFRQRQHGLSVDRGAGAQYRAGMDQSPSKHRELPPGKLDAPSAEW
jgi:hypothetical protein